MHKILPTPAPASRLSQVERWFAELTRKKLRRGARRSVADLNADIMSFIDAHNEKPKPYKWVKSADEILASVRRFCLKANELGKLEHRDSYRRPFGPDDPAVRAAMVSRSAGRSR